MKKGKLTHVDICACRGRLGSKLFQENHLVNIIYCDTYINEDFRDHYMAYQGFQDKFNQRMAAKDMTVTTKYLYDPKLNTGGTFEFNYAAMDGDILAQHGHGVYLTKKNYWSKSSRTGPLD